MVSVVDFRRENILLNESFVKMLGWWTKKILKHMLMETQRFLIKKTKVLTQEVNMLTLKI